MPHLQVFGAGIKKLPSWSTGAFAAVDIRRNVRALADGYVTMQALTVGDRAPQARARCRSS